MASILPALGDLTSTVTLSVSICKRGSSSSTESPCCLRTVAMVPSVIDSPSWGTLTCKLAPYIAEEWIVWLKSTLCSVKYSGLARVLERITGVQYSLALSRFIRLPRILDDL